MRGAGKVIFGVIGYMFLALFCVNIIRWFFGGRQLYFTAFLDALAYSPYDFANTLKGYGDSWALLQVALRQVQNWASNYGFNFQYYTASYFINNDFAHLLLNLPDFLNNTFQIFLVAFSSIFMLSGCLIFFIISMIPIAIRSLSDVSGVFAWLLNLCITLFGF